jgi:hypothetical protein
MEPPNLQNAFYCFDAIDMPKFFLIPMGFIGDNPWGTGQIVKIFQRIRKIYQYLTGINCKHSDFIRVMVLRSGTTLFLEKLGKLQTPTPLTSHGIRVKLKLNFARGAQWAEKFRPETRDRNDPSNLFG